MELDELLATPDGVESWRLDENTLLTLLPELSTRMRQLDALRVRLVHEIDERCAAQTVGAASTLAWLSGTCKLTPGQAKKIITTGHSLSSRPDVADAFTAGTIDTDQVRAITNLLDQIPDLLAGLDPTIIDGELVDPVAECTQQCTDYLVGAAEHEHATDTSNRAAALKTMLEHDHDGPPPDDENEALNEFHASPTTGGRVRVKGHFDKTTGEQLLTALSALSKPQPGRNTTHGEPDPDPRTPAQRRADAFADIVRRYLDSGDAPGEGGEKPHMTVFVGLNDLANATRNTATGTSADSDARSEEDESDEKQCSTGDCDGTCESDTCPLAQAIANATTAAPSFIRRGPAWMPWLGPISMRVAAMTSCDATITPIVMDDNGNPLDVGTTTRTIPRRIRRALDARDCGCAFPGCGRPAAWTDGHPPPSTSCREVPPSTTGPTADPPNSRTWYCSAVSTTASSTQATGRCSSAQTTGILGSGRPDGSTSIENHCPPTTEDNSSSPAEPTQPNSTAPDHGTYAEPRSGAMCVRRGMCECSYPRPALVRCASLRHRQRRRMAARASVTLSRAAGSCSQRLAVVEACARRAGIPTRIEGLVLRGEFWYPRFRYLRPFVPDRVLLAWPSFLVDGEWADASLAFSGSGCAPPLPFTNSGEETLFDAAARSPISWTATNSPSCLNLSGMVLESLGTFDSRDELFATYGQTLRPIVRATLDPVFRRRGAR